MGEQSGREHEREQYGIDEGGEGGEGSEDDFVVKRWGGFHWRSDGNEEYNDRYFDGWNKRRQNFGTKEERKTRREEAVKAEKDKKEAVRQGLVDRAKREWEEKNPEDARLAALRASYLKRRPVEY